MTSPGLAGAAPAVPADAPRGEGTTFLAGFTNIWRKEVSEWFHTRKFIAVAILTTLMVLAPPLIFFLHEGGLRDGRIDSGSEGLLTAWIALSATLGSYLVVALTMGVLIREEEAGTAQWLFTKPVSRGGYVLAKYTANAAVVVLGAVVIPGVCFFAVMLAIQSDGLPTYSGALLALGLVALNACVVIGLVVGLSGFFRSTAPVAGIAIGLNFIPLFFNRIVDGKIIGFFPINAGEVMSNAAEGNHLGPWQPVVSGICIAVAGVAFACWRGIAAAVAIGRERPTDAEPLFR